MGKAKTDDIVERLAARHGAADVASLLSERLSGSELKSLLLQVMRKRSAQVTFTDVMRQYLGDKAVQACTVDARLLAELDVHVFTAAEGFDAVELSPVGPFGLNALVGIDQNNVLSATRATEVLADPTTVMALECAARRRVTDRRIPTRLAVSHRLMRMQPFDDPGFSRHFRLAALVTAGRDDGDQRFEHAALLDHLSVWLRLVIRLRAHGYTLAAARVELSDVTVMRALLAAGGIPLTSLRGHVSPHRWEEEVERRGLALPGKTADPAAVLQGAYPRLAERLERMRQAVAVPLQARFPEFPVIFDLSRLHGVNYYDGPVVHVILRHPGGQEIPLGDGGFTLWTQRLLNDRKERLLTSALGVELLPRIFRSADGSPGPR